MPVRGFVALLISFLLLFGSLSRSEQGSSPSYEPQSPSVEQMDNLPPPKRASTNEAAEGIYFVLVDDQVNAASEQKFHRIIKDFLNENGVQNEARLTINFDPSY